MKRTYKHALVVGASSGIGAAIARLLSKRGARVALLARRESELETVAGQIRAQGGEALVYPHDVTDYKAIPALFDRVRAELGGLDCIVFAAGIMPPIAEGQYDFATDRKILEVNLLGAIAWLDEAALHFESLRSGTIIAISSIAGVRGRRGNPGYCTSKAALSTFVESLRNRMTRYGVNVVTIKPGFVDTAMTQGMKGLFWLISADEAARQTLRIANRRSGSGFVPRRWALVAAVLCHIPSFLFRHSDI